MWPHFIIPESLSFWERSELSRIGVIWIIRQLKNSSTFSRPWKSFLRISRFFHSSLLQGCENKTTTDTSKPYTGAIKGAMRKPQANLGADKKFSPNRFFATRSWWKTMIDTLKPYTRATRGIMHEPQANLREDQKFSPVDVFKQKRVSEKPWGFSGLIKRLHHCHSKIIKWVNQTGHTLWGSSWRDLRKMG